MRKFLAVLSAFAFLALPLSAGYAEEKKPVPSAQELKKAPKFPKGKWFNTPALTKKYFKGRVTLLYFWDYSSINCIREIGDLKKLQRTYRPFGLRVIWVHAPEFKFAGEAENVRNAVRRFGITQPVFLDNDFKLWENYDIRSWPTKVLVNKDGKIAGTLVGEENIKKTESDVRELLKDVNPSAELPEPIFKIEKKGYTSPFCGVMSGETYVGYKRAGWWGARVANQEWVSKDKPVMFKDRGERVERGFFLHGMWENRADDFRHARKTDELSDYLGLIYLGTEVYSMLNSPKDDNARVYVTRDDAPIPLEHWGQDINEDEQGRTYVRVSEPRLYYLIANEDSEPHELKLWTRVKDLSIHSFAFSNQCLSEFDHR